MDANTLQSAAETLWLYLATPLLALAGLVLCFRLGFPPFRGLVQAFRATRDHDEDAEGTISPKVAFRLDLLVTYGAAGSIGAVTAIGLAGPAAIAWSWIFALLVAPIAMAEALMSRTSTPGGGSGPSGSLTRRLWGADSAALRGIGGALLLSAVLVTVFFFAGPQSIALQETIEAVLPGNLVPMLAGASVIAAALALAGPARTGALTSWLGLAGVGALVVTCVWACLADPGRAFSAIPRAFSELFGGAPAVTPFIGATAGQAAVAALVFLLPSLLAPIGIRGGFHALAQARTTRGQAQAAMLGTLAFALLTTLIGMSVQAPGSYYRLESQESSIDSLTLYRGVPETLSQRDETERLYTGVIRVVDGELRDRGPGFATATGGVSDPRFFWEGEPADVALRYVDGQLVTLMRPLEQGILEDSPRDEWARLTVRGEMLPSGASVWTRALRRGTDSPLAGRLGVMALLILLTVTAAGWGMALPSILPTAAPSWLQPAARVLPAAALGLSLMWTGEVVTAL